MSVFYDFLLLLGSKGIINAPCLPFKLMLLTTSRGNTFQKSRQEVLLKKQEYQPELNIKLFVLHLSCTKFYCYA